MSFPMLAIGIITYNRERELLQVLTSLVKYVLPYYPKDRLHFVLADDGSGEDYITNIRKQSPINFHRVVVNNRGGMPVNWNSMIKACEEVADYTLCLQDDWQFTTPVDLRLAVSLLQHNPDYGMVRYHKLTGHVGLPMVMKEWDTQLYFPNYDHNQLGYCEYVQTMLPFMELLPPFDNSNTYSPYSGGVHLRHKAFTAFYGTYPEHTLFSSAEMEYFARVNQSLRIGVQPGIRHRVAMFPSFVQSRFCDLTMGRSYRGTPREAETVANG